MSVSISERFGVSRFPSTFTLLLIVVNRPDTLVLDTEEGLITIEVEKGDVVFSKIDMESVFSLSWEITSVWSVSISVTLVSILTLLIKQTSIEELWSYCLVENL